MRLHENSSVVDDEDGVELVDLEAARVVAVHSARDIICEDIAKGVLHLSPSIEIIDNNGITLLTVPFAAAVTDSNKLLSA